MHPLYRQLLLMLPLRRPRLLRLHDPLTSRRLSMKRLRWRTQPFDRVLQLASSVRLGRSFC
jgi:hypothetical protein